MKTVMIDGVEYVEKVKEGYDLQIVILQRGWVMIGYLNRIDDKWFSLANAHVIRRWGTTKGLGEIAVGGPTSETVLDACNGEVKFHELTVVAMIKAEGKRWEAVLSSK